MKFLCENCKAKYQIADEKVAGRTVRMKCRKCGHMIEVEASVTETSVASRMPTEEGSGGASTGVSASHGAVRAASAGLPPPRPPGPPPPRHAPSPGGAPPPPPGARPLAPKPVPRPAAPGNAGLAGAFSKAVTVPNEDPSSVSAAMAVLSSSSTTEEWYVGINGVPVGPVRLSELRRKAGAGLITEESLVWREGFEEWLPLRTFPELATMLKEGGTRTSLTPAPPPPGAMQSNRPVPPPNWGNGSGARPGSAPRAPVAAGARSNVVALASRRATAEKIDGLSDPVIDEDVSFLTETPPPVGAPPAQPLFPAGSQAAHAHDSSHHSGLGTRFAESRRAHPAAWLVVGLGGMFLGVAAMVFLLPKANSKPAVQIVSVMIPTPPAPTSQGEGEGISSIGPIEVTAPIVTKSSGSGSKGSAKAVDPTGGAAAPPPVNPGLGGLGLVGGPTPGGGSSKSSGGGQLAAVDVERVVQSHRAFVKRQCWESALASRPPGAPSSARVVVTMNIGSDGRVQSANAAGGDGYPGLASCVQGQVKNWTFPPSEGSAVTVPFVFAAQ